MPRSMTGYGHHAILTRFGKFEVEIKSLNHRYLDVSVRLPFHLQEFEESLRKRAAEQVHRGKVMVFIQHENLLSAKDLEFNSEIARFYVRSLRRLKKQLRIEGDINLVQLATLPHVVTLQKDGRLSHKYGAILRPLLNRALRALKTSQEREGRSLVRDLQLRLKALKTLLKRVKSRSPQVVAAYRRRLHTRIGELAGKVPIDEGRLAQEVALFAEKCDISEEITRSLSHLSIFEGTLRGRRQGIGRSLDFMTQELLREINTIGSKSPDAQTAQHVIGMKDVLGKIREQVQNIE